MIVRYTPLAIVLIAVAWGCSSGGGGATSFPTSAWAKFRHDENNTGQGFGPVTDNNGTIKWQTQIDQTPISASPALGIDGTIYIGTEGGTLAAVDPGDGSIKWSVCSCDSPGSSVPVTCPSDQQSSLGQLISSPAVYEFNEVISIFVASTTGALYGFQDDGETRTCSMRFQPPAGDFGSGATVTSRFFSSPGFTLSPITTAIANILIGAVVDIQQNGTSRTVGKVYAVNSDGSTSWQFPRPGQPEIGAVTSSLAVGLAGTLYFTAADTSADGQLQLYALDGNGTFKWKFPLSTTSGTIAQFDPSPLTSITSTLVFASTADGTITALNPDGTFLWSVPPQDDSGFMGSLAVGQQTFVTPTPTLTAAATPTPGPETTATPSPTPTVFTSAQTLFGVTTAGKIVIIQTTTGEVRELPEPTPREIKKPVISSPALSGDAFLIIGAADGKLHAVNTTTGTELAGWPVTLADNVPIRSSPAVDENGVVYVGADNGMLYAVGTP